MDSKGPLYDHATPVRRGLRGGSLDKGNRSLDTPRRAKREKVWSSPKVEETPERATRKGASTRAGREDSRLTEVINGGSTAVLSSPAPLRTPTFPPSPLSTFINAGQSPDTVSKSRKSSFREKLVYLAGSSAYVDMTSIPTKDTFRLAVWIVQQVSHFFEYKYEETNEATPELPNASAADAEPTVASSSGALTGPSVARKSHKQAPSPELEGPREGLRPRKPAKHVHYDDELSESEPDEIDEASAQEGSSGKATAKSRGKAPEVAPSNATRTIVDAQQRYDECPRTPSQKEIYRRNWAVEHGIKLASFKLPDNAIEVLFPADDATLSQNALGLGAILIRILQSMKEPTTLNDEAVILADFTMAVKRTFNDQQALVQAFKRLASSDRVQESVKRYLNKLGKPEEMEFGESDDVLETQQVKVQRPSGRGRPKMVDQPIPLLEATWSSLAAFKPYSTPYPNLTPVAAPVPTQGFSSINEPSNVKGKQADSSADAANIAGPDAPRSHLSESQIDNLLALANNGSNSEDDDDDNAGPASIEDTLRDVEISAVLRRHIQQAAAKQQPGVREEDWTLLPFIMTLADPTNAMSPEQRFTILAKKFADFVTLFVRPKVNAVMSADQAQALSGAYGWMAARMDRSPFRSIYDNDGCQLGGAAGGVGGAGEGSSVAGPNGSRAEGSGRLSKAELDAIKEEVQRDYDEVRARKERGEHVEKEKVLAKPDLRR